MSNPSTAGPNALPHEHDNRGPALLGVIVAFTSIAACATGLRISVRLWITKSPGLDDASITLAIILAIISTIAYGIAIEHGYGRHIKTIAKSDLAAAIKYNLIATVIFYLSLIFSKISVCFLLLRIIGRTRTTQKLVFLYGMMALTVIIGIIAAGYTTGQCQPVAKDWDHEMPGKCHGDISVRIGIAQGTINAVIDFALAAFPGSFLVSSKMHYRRKLIIGALMSCGVIAGMCSIARVVVSSVLVNSGDFTYVEVAGTYLAVTEEAASIIIACIPTLMPLVKTLRGLTLHTRTRSSGKGGKGRSWPALRSVERAGIGEVGGGVEPFEMTGTVTTAERASRPDVEGFFGSDVDLVPRIGKLTEIDVQRNERRV